MPWIAVARRSALDGRDMISASWGAYRLALYALEDGIYATNNQCPHLGALLSHGCVVQGYVECPMHHALFDIRTGVSDGSVTDRNVQTYPVKVDGDDIYVDLPAEEPAS